ncbi:regulatory helix-turn-helix protein, lysR family [Stigmatella aurantiaca]|uniref:Regulatory helix-turn-helix protein, lysR family n=1 Tax=Stigmatella aurantiaca TaxID=41 RepID=A0A1H7HYB6_STIAU|nr:LysR family transcriptional regulator [Stigmatella aurantiaca]SEK55239.1 regulatory helix-turn-helix protein, lysR family [Stigmatella aurantiaca]
MKTGLHGAGLAELNAVVAVATHKNFRAAASELGLSPSALSHAIASLEKRLGVRLFHRTTRSVALSDAGESFLSRVKPALAALPLGVLAARRGTRRGREGPTHAR